MSRAENAVRFAGEEGICWAPWIRELARGAAHRRPGGDDGVEGEDMDDGEEKEEEH